jgi:hypothetical protein
MKKLFLILACIFLLFNIVAAQETTTTTLRFIWDSNTESDLAGYGFYSSLDPGPPYSIIEDEILPSETETVNFTIEGVVVNINAPTYFSVDAYDVNGNRSGFSNPCEYTHCVPLPEETQVVSCGTGYTGEKTQKRTSSCAFNSMPVWSAWVDVSNTCKAIPVCTPLPDETQTLSCPAGQTGSITQSRSSSCPDQYGTPVWGVWTQTSNTCKAVSTCVSKTETRTTRCTKWYEKGSILQSHTLVCNSDGTSYWTPWTVLSSTCRPWWKK